MSGAFGIPENVAYATAAIYAVLILASLIVLFLRFRNPGERYQDVGVVLEDLSSYERRGLLKPPSGTAYFPPPPGGVVKVEAEATRAYEPAQDDVVI